MGAGETNQRTAGRRGNLASICDDDFEQYSRDRESVAKRGVFNHGRDNQRSGHIRDEWIRRDWSDGRSECRDGSADSIAGHHPE